MTAPETRELLTRRAIDELNAGGFPTDGFAEDVEVVMKDGIFRGTRALAERMDAQRRQFEQTITVERFDHVGDWTVVAVVMDLVGRDPKLGSLRAWPAWLLCFDADRVTYFEGYPDRRAARVAAESRAHVTAP